MDDSDNKPTHKLQRSTRLVHGGKLRTEFCETSEALFLTSGFAYPDAETAQARLAGDEPGYVYSRYANPTLKMLEERLIALESGANWCRMTSSGMAAIHASLVAPIQAGDRIVASRALFSSCFWILNNLMPKFGVDVDFVDGHDFQAWEHALSQPVRLVLIETPSNPLLEAVDIAKIAELAHMAGGQLVVDNVFATPILQSPLELGADWVVYSCTKHMDGQGRVLAGAILGRNSDQMDEIFDSYLKHTGPALSPFNAWTILKGVETLELRVEKMSANADRVANFLSGHPAVANVRYPGHHQHPHYNIHAKQMSTGGTLVAFSINGGKKAAFEFLNTLEILTISNNLGDTKSLICHPSTTTHRTLSDEEKTRIGLDDSWLRLSVGLEDADDLCEDLDRALNKLN